MCANKDGKIAHYEANAMLRTCGLCHKEFTSRAEIKRHFLASHKVKAFDGKVYVFEKPAKPERVQL